MNLMFKTQRFFTVLQEEESLSYTMLPIDKGDLVSCTHSIKLR